MTTKLLMFLAAVLGLTVGMLYQRPALADLTGYQLAVDMVPPTLSDGSSPLLNCGWHGTCGTTPTVGTALDWEDGGTNYGNPWYFREFFYSSGTTNRRVATGAPLVTVQDPNKCDVMTVWIIEYHSGALRAIPNYLHVNISDSTQFAINGGPWTVYQSRHIGDTINDSGTMCTFTGSHVHEDHTDYRTDIVAITRDTAVYPTAQNCSNNCGYYLNNDIYRWTNRFAWAEGAN